MVPGSAAGRAGDRGSGSLMRRIGALAVTPRRWPEIAIGVARIAWGVVQRAANTTYLYGSWLRSFARRRKDFVEERWVGRQSLDTASRVAVFSHFDREGALHDFVDHYVRQLADAGFAVVFVSNSPRLPPATVERLLPSCALVLRRANVGYDFGAYKDGIAEVPAPERLESLIVANDSVYGPFHPLGPIVARMDDGADVWGITDSWEHRYHLQSFFVLFRRPAVQSPAFAAFWRQVRYVQAKDWIIGKYEIGMTRELAEAGLRCRSLFPYRAAESALLEAAEGGDLHPERFDPIQQAFLGLVVDTVRRNGALNGTHYFWDFLIERLGCPFLKRELLRDNPEGVPFVGRWEQVVRSASAYDTGLIARHLAVALGGRPVPDPEPPDRPRRAWYGSAAGPPAAAPFEVPSA